MGVVNAISACLYGQQLSKKGGEVKNGQEWSIQSKTVNTVKTVDTVKTEQKPVKKDEKR